MAHSNGIKFSTSFIRLLVFIAVLNGLNGIWKLAGAFSAQHLYTKDFIQPYLMAKAIRSGNNPYLPLPQLANQLMNLAHYDRLPHPTPHPPVLGLIGLPFSFLSFETAALCWLVFQLACLLAAILLLYQWWRAAIRPGAVVIWFLLVLGWIPIIEDLWWGQLTLVLLMLALSAWLTLRNGQFALGGTLLGGLIALKLTAWPVVIFLALRRKWRSVIAAGVVVLAANLLAVAVIGFTTVRDYYLKVGPFVAVLYRSHDCNYSVWTLGTRLFKGFGFFFQADPLFYSPALAALFTYMLPLLVLAVGLWLAWRAAEFDTAFCLLTGVGLIISPVTWPHYLMWSVIPIAILVRRLWLGTATRRMLPLIIIFWLLLSLSTGFYIASAKVYARQTTPNGLPLVPFAAGLITLVPLVALIGLLWLVWWSDAVKSPEHEAVVLSCLPDRLVEDLANPVRA